MEGEAGHGVLFHMGEGGKEACLLGLQGVGSVGGVAWRGKRSWVSAGGSGVSHSSERLEIWEGLGGVGRSCQM